MTNDRTGDLVILLGHALQCETCRDKLLRDPERVAVGRKLSAEQRERLAQVTPEAFENTLVLASVMGVSVDELRDGINHPRARMRHL